MCIQHYRFSPIAPIAKQELILALTRNKSRVGIYSPLYFLEPLAKLAKKNNMFPIILTLVRSLRRSNLRYLSDNKISITGTQRNLVSISVSNNLKSLIRYFSRNGYLGS